MSSGHQPPNPSDHTEPPWSGWIETTGDALLILEAARRGLIPRVTRRLVDSERRMITSGSVFVFDEVESGIKRWTDGFYWSPSRILGNFLLYRETDKRGAGHRSARAEQELIHQEAASSSAALGGMHVEGQSLSRPKTDNTGLNVDKQRERALIGSLTNSYKFKPDGLMKKTFSVTIGGVAQHLISYYKIADVESGRLRSPSSLPELAALDISPEYLDKTHFRNPPKVEIGVDGIPRYRGESDDAEGNSAISMGYQHGINVGQVAADPPNNMLGGPVPVPAPAAHPEQFSGQSGNLGAKRPRFEPYAQPESKKRKPSEPPSAIGTSTSAADNQSPSAHQMSVSPRLAPSGVPPYDSQVTFQQRLDQQSMFAQQRQATQYPEQQPVQQNQQVASPGSTVPQYMPPYYHHVAPPGYPPPHNATWSQPYTMQHSYPAAYSSTANMPLSIVTASPMSTSSDSPSPSPMHVTHGHAHPAQRGASVGAQNQNPTSGLQNVAAVGGDSHATSPSNSAHTSPNTTTHSEPLARDPSQNTPGQNPRQEPVLQHHHPPGGASHGSPPASTINASTSGGANTGASPPTSANTPAPVMPAIYHPYYPPPGHSHMPPPVMGSLAAPQGAGHPGQRAVPIPMMPGMGMGMPPPMAPFAPNPYAWTHPPPHPGMYPPYTPYPAAVGGGFAYGQPFGAGVPGPPAGGTTQTPGGNPAPGSAAGPSGTTASGQNAGGGSRAGASGSGTEDA